MQPKIHPAIASQHYRMLDLQSRVASASPHGLVGLLYEELLRSLDLINAKHAQGKVIAGNTHLSRALSIIVALEGSLDFTNGGELAPILHRIYRSAARSMNEAAKEDNINKINDVRSAISDQRHRLRLAGTRLISRRPAPNQRLSGSQLAVHPAAPR